MTKRRKLSQNSNAKTFETIKGMAQAAFNSPQYAYALAA